MKTNPVRTLINLATAFIVAINITACTHEPSSDEINLLYHTETVPIEVRYTSGAIDTIDIMTKVANAGDDVRLKLVWRDLKNYWCNTQALNVENYKVLQRYNQPEQNDISIHSKDTMNSSFWNQESINYKIKLPEHYTSITMDNNHPTDLTGFIRNDSIIINFKNY